mgnify:CR=1 FL=1
MYYQNYEDYIKSILGYPISQDNNSYQTNTYTYPSYSYNNYNQNIPRYSSEILNLYPEIYKVVNPMVCKICEANSKPITAELIEQMTDEIYANIECDNEEEAINVRVTLPKEKSFNSVKKENLRENRNTHANNSNVSSRALQNNLEKTQKKQEDKSINVPQNRQNRRSSTNNTLRDLIKILILNQLLGGNRPNRPEMPRPPYPVRPI